MSGNYSVLIACVNIRLCVTSLFLVSEIETMPFNPMGMAVLVFSIAK